MLVWQNHGGKIVVADHGLVGAVNDNLNRKLRLFHKILHLGEGKLQRSSSHGYTVLLHKAGGLMIEQVKGKVCLYW